MKIISEITGKEYATADACLSDEAKFCEEQKKEEEAKIAEDKIKKERKEDIDKAIKSVVEEIRAIIALEKEYEKDYPSEKRSFFDFGFFDNKKDMLDFLFLNNFLFS